MKASSSLLFLFLFSISINAQYWRVIEKSPMPESVANNAVVEGFVDGVPYLYSFGGIDSTKNLEGIHLRSFRYNTQTDIWESIPPLPDTLGKIAAGASRIGNIIYIIGGYHVFPTTEISSNRVHRYDIQSNSYLADGAPIPVAIDDQVQAVWRDSLIYVVTGWRGNSNTQGNVPNVQIYDPVNDSWSSGTPVPDTDLFKAFGASGTIIGDTIFYYGGAAGVGFGITGLLRKGIINPNNPGSVGWLALNGDPDHQGYRMGATSVDGNPYWLGGSGNTYNFDGIAYDNSGGVPPANRSLFYDLSSQSWQVDLNNPLPMDLRGVGEVSDTVKYLTGGMLADQIVTNKTYRLERSFSPVVSKVIDWAPAEQVELSPNPGSGAFVLKKKGGLLEGMLEVWDSRGVLVFRERIAPAEQYALDLGQLENGLYWVKVEEEVKTLLLMK